MMHLDLVPLEDVKFTDDFSYITSVGVLDDFGSHIAARRIARMREILAVKRVTVLRLRHPGHIHTLCERILQIVHIVVVVVHILAVCHLIIVLVNLLETVIESLLSVVLVRIYHENVRAAVILCVLDEYVALVRLLDSGGLRRVEFNLDDVIDQMILVSQTEYLVEVDVRYRVSVI